MNNSKFLQAKSMVHDEFYTQPDEILEELCHYGEFFMDKTVYCNCDDPATSGFWGYFVSGFERLHLKKLVATCLSCDKPAVKTEYYGAGKLMETPLMGNGDFRSRECIDLLIEADVVVTNPPFSLFRQYVAQLAAYDKKFVIIGPLSAVTYRNFFPLLKNGKVRTGYNFNKTLTFRMPDTYEVGKSGYMENGRKFIKMSSTCWFTNLDIKKPVKELVLQKHYDAWKYPFFDNFDAIDIKRVADIPADYYGFMGVPISFIGKHCPAQFEIVALLTDSYGDGLVQGSPVYVDEKHKRSVCGVVNGKRVFPRIIIRRKGGENGQQESIHKKYSLYHIRIFL